MGNLRLHILYTTLSKYNNNNNNKWKIIFVFNIIIIYDDPEFWIFGSQKSEGTMISHKILQ